MRCDLHCPTPAGGGGLRVLCLLATFAAVVTGIVCVVTDPGANAIADVAFQVLVGVTAASIATWGAVIGGRALYEHLRSPGERRKYYAALAAQRQAVVTAGQAQPALSAVPTYRPTHLPTEKAMQA